MDFNVPELGEGVYEAEFVSWHIKPGDKVKRGQVLMEVMTDKATMEVPSPFAGTVSALKAEPGQVIKVGRPILTYTGEGEESAAAETPAEKKERRSRKTAAAKAEAVPMATPVSAGNGPKVAAPLATLAVKAAPSVRLMARKLGIDLAGIPGSGPGGRVLLEISRTGCRCPVLRPPPDSRPSRPPTTQARRRIKLMACDAKSPNAWFSPMDHTALLLHGRVTSRTSSASEPS